MHLFRGSGGWLHTRCTSSWAVLGKATSTERRTPSTRPRAALPPSCPPADDALHKCNTNGTPKERGCDTSVTPSHLASRLGWMTTGGPVEHLMAMWQRRSATVAERDISVTHGCGSEGARPWRSVT
eukprot:1191603-Prorocentrum_minimum.AAC.3